MKLPDQIILTLSCSLGYEEYNSKKETSVSEYAYTIGQLGNATATYTYSYDTVWKDKLLSYDGKRITYDAIGSPTSYMGAAMTWSNGRELSSIVDGNKTISYNYTTDGIRLSKTVNNIKTSYVLDGSTILSETTGNETLNYYYDSTGDLQQIGYKKGTAAEVYYLVAHNGQGDVIAIYNGSDSKLVGTYTYDAWGKVLSTDDASSTSDPNGILTKNPFRYRGYYYDMETGFYYLQSRYYNPGLGRFINADSFFGETGDLLGHNLFAYTKNNPVNMVDPNGQIAYPGQIHNAVVSHIQANYAAIGMLSNKMVDYSFGFGFADLVNIKTGEVWEVKRNTLSVSKARSQLAKYTSNRLHDERYKNLPLKTGGSAGTNISPGSFVMKSNIDDYYVKYWDMGNGIIQYDYYKITNWDVVGDITIGIVVIAGATYLIVQTGGAAAPVLLPLLEG